MDKLARVAEEFQTHLSKKGAKEKTSRKRLDKDLAKSKSEYGRIRSIQDDLENKKAEIDSKLEKVRAECGAARKKMLKMHKTVQDMDISNASDAIFYDSEDIGYIIGGKEYYLQFNEEGVPEKVPMLQWRRDRKARQMEERALEEGNEEDVALVEDFSENTEKNEELEDLNDVAFSDDEMSDLYSFLSE